MNVAKQYGVSQEAAHKMVQSYDPRANKVWDSMVQSEIGQELAQIKAGKVHVENIASTESATFKAEYSGKINDQGQKDLQQQAAKEGLDHNLMQYKIQNTGTDLTNKQTDMTNNANKKIDSTGQQNTALEQGMNRKVQEYERNRMTKNLVGGTTSKEKAGEYLKNNEKAAQAPYTNPLKQKDSK